MEKVAAQCLFYIAIALPLGVLGTGINCGPVDIQLIMIVVDILEIGEMSFTRRGLKLKISFRTRAEQMHVTSQLLGDRTSSRGKANYMGTRTGKQISPKTEALQFLCIYTKCTTFIDYGTRKLRTPFTHSQSRQRGLRKAYCRVSIIVSYSSYKGLSIYVNE